MFFFGNKFNDSYLDPPDNSENAILKCENCDNIIRIVLDGLNGMAHHDDSQICKVHFQKNYSEAPWVAVLIRNIGEIYEQNKNL